MRIRCGGPLAPRIATPRTIGASMTGSADRSDGRPARHRRTGRRIDGRAAGAGPRSRRPDVDRRVRAIRRIHCPVRCDSACSTRWIASASPTAGAGHRRAGADVAAVRALLRRLSLVDRVVAHVEAAGAPVRYRRVRSAIAELHALAAQSGDQQLAEFLTTDDTVLAVMAAAVDVVEADGMRVDRGDDPAAHLHPRGALAALRQRAGQRPAPKLLGGHLPRLAAPPRTVSVTSESTNAKFGSTPTRSPRPTPWWRRSSPA